MVEFYLQYSRPPAFRNERKNTNKGPLIFIYCFRSNDEVGKQGAGVYSYSHNKTHVVCGPISLFPCSYFTHSTTVILTASHISTVVPTVGVVKEEHTSFGR